MSSCSVKDTVKVFSRLYGKWVTGTVTHVYPNGDIQVVGIDSWEGAIVRCKPEEAKSDF